MNDYAKLPTEQRNQLSMEFDTLSTLDAVTLMNQIDADVITAVNGALPDIAATIDVIDERMRRGGRLIYCGAGTSGRLGVLDASECPPTFGVDPGLVVGIMAGGDTALRNAVEGAEDSPDLGARDMDSIGANEDDVVVAISASGSAPYCIGALKRAKELGAACIALACVPEPATGNYADISIRAVTGPEILSGSTRLKAGTATKMVLNMLTTITMVKQGKVYKNLMVDMKRSNKKLFDRAIRIVERAVDCDRAKAEEMLNAADGNVKVAIVHGISGATIDVAQAALTTANGYVRQAIALCQEGANS